MVEAILDDPFPVLMAQEHKARGEAVAEMKAQGIEYDERMELLEEVSYPKPLGEPLLDALRVYSESHPWVRRGRTGGSRDPVGSAARVAELPSCRAGHPPRRGSRRLMPSPELCRGAVQINQRGAKKRSRPRHNPRTAGRPIPPGYCLALIAEAGLPPAHAPPPRPSQQRPPLRRRYCSRRRRRGNRRLPRHRPREQSLQTT